MDIFTIIIIACGSLSILMFVFAFMFAFIFASLFVNMFVDNVRSINRQYSVVLISLEVRDAAIFVVLKTCSHLRQ